MPTLRTTHTVVEMEVSDATYDEIAGILRSAGYDHCFLSHHDEGLIDLTGLGIRRKEKASDTRQESLPLEEPKNLGSSAHDSGADLVLNIAAFAAISNASDSASNDTYDSGGGCSMDSGSSD